ncbi:hypothetical protein HanIR_Chr15g0755901 [Helianthus annuus]|nr:hypothetical protein HanIR_Chr15g0755901 [Helianthus annuus]
MLKYTSVFYDLMMRSWPYTCVDQWPGFVHSVRKYTSVHSRTPPYALILLLNNEHDLPAGKGIHGKCRKTNGRFAQPGKRGGVKCLHGWLSADSLTYLAVLTRVFCNLNRCETVFAL